MTNLLLALLFACNLLIAVPMAKMNVFKPLPWQITPWRDRSPVMLLTGSAGGGKSNLAAEKMNGLMKRYPGAFGIMARKTRQSMINSTILFFERTIIAGDPTVRHMASKHRFEYQNGSLLAYGGMADEAQREQLRSVGPQGNVDFLWLEEMNKFVFDDLQETYARMRGRAAGWTQIIGSTNPDYPQHWINQELILGGGAQVYYSSAADNPYNPPSYQAMLDRLSGVMRQRLRDGLWVQAEGAVYEEWDPTVHIIDPFSIPASWRRFRAIDFGYTNPFVCQWWAMDPDGRLYLYREIYMSQVLVEDHARHILKLSAGERFEDTVSDWDAEDNATLAKYGVGTTLAVKEISPGIQAVQARLRIAGDGKPRLFIMRGALVEVDEKLAREKKPTSTEDEVPGYVWPKLADGKPVKEVPVKENDHGLDALRYLVMRVDGGPEILTPGHVAVSATPKPPPARPSLGLFLPTKGRGRR